MVNAQTAIRQPNRVFDPVAIHPSECRSFAYAQETRSQAIDNRLHGDDGPENATILRQRGDGLYPSEQTVDRWMRRYNQYGHVQAFQRTGNQRS